MPASGEQGRSRRALVALCLLVTLLLAPVDYVMLDIAIGFGPSGFGGDRTMTRTEVVTSYVGQAAGVVALLLVPAAFAVAAMPASRRRDRDLVVVVVAQGVATVVLVGSQILV